MELRAAGLTMEFTDAGNLVRVFGDLSFSFESNRSVAIVGRSGVGKTTLLNILAALEQPTAGKVHIGETCITDLARKGDDVARFRGKNIGYIFQFHHLFPEFDALENVAMPLFLQGLSKTEALAQAANLLAQVGLKERATHRPGALSGGEQQRVAIARAISTRPGVLLADEPTGNLDQQTGFQVVNLLVELQKTQGMTLVVVTHSFEIAALMDRVVELTPQGMIERTKDQLTALHEAGRASGGAREPRR